MRVVHVSPTAFGSAGLFGGGERYPVELTRALRRLIDCKLVTFGSVPHTDRDVTVLQTPLLLGGHPAHPIPRRLARELAGADLVHVHHMVALPSLVAAVAAWRARQPRVVTDHGLGPGPLPQLTCRLFDRFLTVSRYSAETLLAPEAKTDVIYGGADVHRFRPDPKASRAGVLFIGRLTPHKGVDRLIQALPNGASLVVGGSAGHDRRLPERNYPALVRELARDRDVRFVGAVAEDALPTLYRTARVFVLPSVDVTCYGKRIAVPELLGLSLLEAMASGTPVIASRVGGLSEVVVDGETGFVVEPADTAELHARLEQLLGDDRLAERLGANGRQHVLERFTWDRCAERCVDAYERVIGAA